MTLTLVIAEENFATQDLAIILAKVNVLRGRVEQLKCAVNAEIFFRSIEKDVEGALPLVRAGMVRTPGLLKTIGIILTSTMHEPCLKCHHLKVMADAVWKARLLYDDTRSPIMQAGTFMYLAEKEISLLKASNG
jgi:hypothetical protein